MGSAKNIFYSLVFISVFKPQMFNHWDIADLFSNFFSVIFLLTFSMKFLFKFIRERKAKMMTVLVMLIHAIVLLSTYIHHGNFRHWGMALVSSGTLALFLELYAKDVRNIIKAWFPLVEICLLVNLVTLLTGGVGSDDWLTEYFLGSKNTFEVVFASYLIVIYLNKKFHKKNNLHYIFCYLLMIIAVLVTRSATMLMELSIFIILLLFNNNLLTRRIIDYRYLLSAFIIANVLLIIYAINSDLNVVTDYLEYETNKGSSSFLTRIKMWVAGAELIKAYPILGIGRMAEETWIIYVGAGDYKTQLHNQIVEYLVSGGVVLLSVLIAIYVLAAYNLHKCKKNSIIILLTLICFSLNIANMAEAYYNALYFFPFLLTAYLPQILNEIPKRTFVIERKINSKSNQ